MDQDKSSYLDSLFDVEFENTQPLRKYEPLIRVDLDGKPLPRKLLSQEPLQSFKPTFKPEPKPQAQPQSHFNDRKRSPPESTEPKLEPKKKQPKGQSKITAFFNKS